MGARGDTQSEVVRLSWPLEAQVCHEDEGGMRLGATKIRDHLTGCRAAASKVPRTPPSQSKAYILPVCMHINAVTNIISASNVFDPSA